MAKNSGQPARDLFPGHNVGAGKGSATRTNFARPEWQQGFSEINWPGVTGLVRVGNKQVKKYKL